MQLPAPNQASALLRAGRSLLALLAVAAPAVAQQFPAGGVYLYSGYLPLPPNQFYQGIVRVDPATGSTQPFASVHSTTGSAPGHATYDPFRDRILVNCTAVGGGFAALHAFDAAGVPTQLSSTLLQHLAPRGDGIVYGYQQGTAPSYVPRIRYFDAANVVHTLLDVGGTTEWGINGSSPVFGDPIRAMIYEPAQNALFVAFYGDNATPSCAGTANFFVTIRKLPLTANGTALRAAASCTTFDVTGLAGAWELPLQWSHGPAGSLVLAVKPNDGGALPRLLRVDPASMAITPFATVGPYPGDAGLDCGVYSPLHGRALVWDGSNNRFRSFGQGESGSGTPLASYGVGGSGESQMFVTGPIGPAPSLTADTFTVSASLGGAQNYTYAPGAAFAGDFYLIVGSLSGWSPGLPLGNGFVLPINFDALTELSLQFQNTSILVNTAGTMPPSGQIQAQLNLPPGVLTFLAGWTLHFAALSHQSPQHCTHVSNPVPLTLLP
jgi:hypothetical protein